MTDSWQEMIKTNIQEYISKVDFRNPDFSLNELKKELGQIVGIIPAVQLKWNKQEKVNELLKQAGAKNHTETIEKVEGLSISFVDADNKPIQFKFII